MQYVFNVVLHVSGNHFKSLLQLCFILNKSDFNEVAGYIDNYIAAYSFVLINDHSI